MLRYFSAVLVVVQVILRKQARSVTPHQRKKRQKIIQPVDNDRGHQIPVATNIQGKSQINTYQGCQNGIKRGDGMH